MSIQFSQASAARIQAVNFDSEARDVQAVDLTIYGMWLQARATGDDDLARYIEARFTPAFAKAFADWQKNGENLRSPFAEPSYVPEGREDAAIATEKADKLFKQALVNNRTGDNYTLLTVLFALVLFFTAISERGRNHWTKWLLLGLGVAFGGAGVVVMLTFPVII